MKTLGLAIAFCLFSLNTIAEQANVKACQKPYAQGRHELFFNIEGVKRRAIIYIPKNYTGKKASPLVFNLHGTTSKPEAQLELSKAEPLADKHGFILAAMEGYQQRWNAARDAKLPDDVVLAEHIIDWAKTHVCLDDGRIFSTGFSGGGRTSSRLACALGHRIRAIAPIAGVRHDPPCNVSHISMLTVHGSADTVNPMNGCEPGSDCSRNNEWVENVEDAVADWRASNYCNSTFKSEKVSKNVERRAWHCEKNTRVVYYRVEGGGHQWMMLPNTSELVFEFFASF